MRPDDKVFVRGSYTWNACARPASRVSSEWLHMFTIRDGKLAGFDEYTDTAQFAEVRE